MESTKVNIEKIIQISMKQKNTALEILDELKLLEKWKRYGRPAIVGAMAYDLMIGNDIDLEIYCPILRSKDGFKILSECSENINVKKTLFLNRLFDEDKAFYWQINYLKNGKNWKIDMWSAKNDYDLPRSEDLIEPMHKALNEEYKRIILTLKYQLTNNTEISCLSIDLYRAVIDHKIKTIYELKEWIKQDKDIGKLTNWKPRSL